MILTGKAGPVETLGKFYNYKNGDDIMADYTLTNNTNGDKYDIPTSDLSLMIESLSKTLKVQTMRLKEVQKGIRP